MRNIKRRGKNCGKRCNKLVKCKENKKQPPENRDQNTTSTQELERVSTLEMAEEGRLEQNKSFISRIFKK